MPNVYYAYPLGMLLNVKNGYKMIASGATLHKTDILEAMILDAAGVPIARNTEDLRPLEF